MTLRPALASRLALGLALGVLGTTSCEEDNEVFDDAPLTAEQREACSIYCDRAAACDDDFDFTECNAECVDSLEECFEENVDEAADELATCIDEDECLDVVSCSFQVSGECFFGT